VVTGGAGFLGRQVVKKLVEQGAAVSIPRSSSFDLTRREEVRRMYSAFDPEIVIHLAAVCGGIGANQKEPGRFLYENLVMGAEMIEAARAFEVKKFVQVGTVCSYPKDCPVPFKETDIWNGFPEPTNAPYGIAKKTLMEMCRAYRAQYGLNAITVVPVNLYGPYDNFDLDTSHVIPALIRKCLEAKASGEPSIHVWGTGKASREFLYVEDCAEGIVLAVQKYESSYPVNLGTGSEITVAELIDEIKRVTGYAGETVYDPSKPDGQPRRCLDVSRAKVFGFSAKTNLSEGLKETVRWYASAAGIL
jgi:GDP-L-fucose synthase